MMDAWSKRRAAVAAEKEAEAAVIAEAEKASREAEVAERTDEELLEEFDLPDPDTLQEGDDFKVFMSEAVPARLKQRALRRLWRLNPILANVDGLVEYGEDYTDAATVVENLQTAYQVGKGMLKHVEELARQAEALAEADDAALEEELDADVAEAPDVADSVEEDMPVDVAELAPADAPEVDAFAPAGKRRMRFTFEDEVPA